MWEGARSKNRERVLPAATIVNMTSIRKCRGKIGGAERIVIDQRSGKAYYTANHYRLLPMN